MSLELQPDGAEVAQVIGFEGEYTVADLHRFIKQIDSDVRVSRVEITIEPEERFSLRLPLPDGIEDEDGGPAPVETSSRVQIDSAPFKILTVLEGSDDPLRTEEVFVELSDSVDLSQNAVASRLWNLYKRGLVDKQPYPDDKRQKVYSLTGRGVYALEQARDREE